MRLKEQGYQYLIQGDYQKAADLYKYAIEESETDNISYYWYLGLALLLGEQEIEAQMAWMLPLSDGNAEEIDQRAVELVQVLETEAERLEQIQEYKLAWVIRQHIHQINPNKLKNILNTIQLSSKLDIYDEDELALSEAALLINSDENIQVNTELLLQVLQIVLEIYPLQICCFDFVVSCILTCHNIVAIIDILYTHGVLFIRSLTHEQLKHLNCILLNAANNNISILINIANLFQNSNKNVESLIFIEEVLKSSPSLVDEVATNYLTIRAWMQTGGYWDKAETAYKNYETSLNKLITFDHNISETHVTSLITTVSFASYFQDEPLLIHQFRNRVSQFCQQRIQKYSNQGLPLYQSKQSFKKSLNFSSKLKIGYISTCMRRHSVGWLSRWLFQHHNKENFEIYTYSLQKSQDSLQEFFFQNSSFFYDLSESKELIEIAEHIYQDKIDLLVDLDSVTSNKVCGVMALKPAPVQVTWLGSDASGLPAIDYFIADPYVLPESADNYYASKIWRLPSTYVAVDGFEVGIPTLRREELNIPNDAVIYLTSQTAYKRHPNTVRLQIKIIKQVPGSYLLIKGQSNQDTIKTFFEQIAEEEGVDSSRLRFLPLVDSELVHRANLGIADVVLDTYPYNGATTTLETLWMGIPLVTKVGEQFAARNSYTMMVNAGITEGIAWTDEEYIEWGIRLGKDVDLRQQVVWKLRQSKHTAPLWNAKQFSRDMESAYEQMWQRYLEGK